MKKLILASTSIYRQNLMHRLGIAFTARRPLFDEEKYTKSEGEPVKLAQTLAFLKAESLWNSLASEGLNSEECTVIAGDQLVSFQNKILGKPQTREKAIAQLTQMQGQKHELVTAVCVLDAQKKYEFQNITAIEMRVLTKKQIEAYVDLDQPLDCAGSYKFEKHGIALIAKLQTEDPTAIEGLPLIQLSKILQECGYENFSSAHQTS